MLKISTGEYLSFTPESEYITKRLREMMSDENDPLFEEYQDIITTPFEGQKLFSYLEIMYGSLEGKTLWSIATGPGIFDIYARLAGMEVKAYDSYPVAIERYHEIHEKIFNELGLSNQIKPCQVLTLEHRMDTFPGHHILDAFSSIDFDALHANYWFMFPYDDEAKPVMKFYSNEASLDTKFIVNTARGTRPAVRNAIWHQENINPPEKPFPFQILSKKRM